MPMISGSRRPTTADVAIAAGIGRIVDEDGPSEDCRAGDASGGCCFSAEATCAGSAFVALTLAACPAPHVTLRGARAPSPCRLRSQDVSASSERKGPIGAAHRRARCRHSSDPARAEPVPPGTEPRGWRRTSGPSAPGHLVRDASRRTRVASSPHGQLDLPAPERRRIDGEHALPRTRQTYAPIAAGPHQLQSSMGSGSCPSVVVFVRDIANGRQRCSNSVLLSRHRCGLY